MGIRSWFKKSWSQPPIWSIQHPLNSPFINSGNPARERIENDFLSYVEGAYKRNGPIFACMAARQMVFSEARFQFRRFQDGRPTTLFGGGDLKLLEKPWPSGTTGELLSRMIQDVDLAGNFFATKCDERGRLGNAASGDVRIVRMRPDWVTIVVGSNSGDPNDLDARVLAYRYTPINNFGGNAPSGKEILLMPDEVCHFSPHPDPVARFRGMSWMTPILKEIEADMSATEHKKSFLDNAAVPNMAIKFDRETSADAFNEFVEKFKGSHEGSWNAYKTLFLMGGADVTPLTHDFRQMEFNQTIGKGESRIAQAAGVPSSWVGFSEGMQGSALNSGNFSAARRRFADGTIRPLWRMASASLEILVKVPNGASLWYDDRDIAFLREDSKDRAEIMRINMNAADAAIKAGFEPDAAVEAILNDDIGRLVGAHTGLVSVQMQPPVKPQDTGENQMSKDEANIMADQAKIIQSFVQAGFTEDSAVDAVVSNDLTKLVAAPNEFWTPSGFPMAPGQPGVGKPAPDTSQPAPAPQVEGPSKKPPAKPPKPAPAPAPKTPKGGNQS